MACPGEQEHPRVLLLGTPRERDRFENTGVHREVSLKLMLKE
jgi:hypothetical protein